MEKELFFFFFFQVGVQWWGYACDLLEHFQIAVVLNLICSRNIVAFFLKNNPKPHFPGGLELQSCLVPETVLSPIPRRTKGVCNRVKGFGRAPGHRPLVSLGC